MLFKVLLVVVCGLAGFSKASVADTRIIGGQDADIGQFPFMTSIRVDNEHICSGIIISARTVLTAAHCKTNNILQTLIVVGTNTLGGGGVSHRVSSFIQHPNYNQETAENDIGLYIVSLDFMFNDVVQSIKLPTYNVGDGAPVTVSGWGLTSYPGSLANKLQYLRTRTISANVCKQNHSPLFETQICTLTKEGQGICSGDSGSPLLANDQVHGIASVGYLCAGGKPDVFTRVVLYNRWINQNLVN